MADGAWSPVDFFWIGDVEVAEVFKERGRTGLVVTRARTASGREFIRAGVGRAGDGVTVRTYGDGFIEIAPAS